MAKSYKNNGAVYLAFYLEKADQIEELLQFTGERRVFLNKKGEVIINTLAGWVPVCVGSYVLHLFATDDAPAVLSHEEEETFYESGFLVINKEGFEKHFDPIVKEGLNG